MREEFEKLVAAGKITPKHIDPLVALAESGYCRHRSWGFGRITQVDPVFARFHIDFQDKPGHSMDLAFAAATLTPIASDHILARMAQDIDAVKQMAALHALDLVKIVLQSRGGQATTDQIQEILVPRVIDEDWRKWWTNAKKAMKKDGHFIVPLKKSQPIVYQEQEVSLKDRLMEEFKAAKGLKARLVVATEILKNLEDIQEPGDAVAEAVTMLNSEIASHQRTMPSLALEAVFVRDDLATAVGLAPAEGQLNPPAIWIGVNEPGKVLEAVAAARHKRALQSFKETRPDVWDQVLLGIFNSVGTRLCTECAHLLIDSGKLDELKQMLALLISQHNASSEVLLWLSKERSDAFADTLGPEVFRAMLTAIERDQFNEKKSNRLADHIMDDQNLLIELIESADIEVIQDLTRALNFSSSFDDMDKRSLLARIVKHFPSVQPLISGDHAREEKLLIVSWPSLERRKGEYDDLVHKKIPANSRDIAIARGYGDLSENHEYKAAKETHRLLMLRKGELEQQLARSRGTDFSDVRPTSVGIGTRITVTELGKENPETFNILGAWDGDPERQIISYLSPIAQALLGRETGNEAELEIEGHSARYRIDSIEKVPEDLLPKAEPVEEEAASEPAESGAPKEVSDRPEPPAPTVGVSPAVAVPTAPSSVEPSSRPAENPREPPVTSETEGVRTPDAPSSPSGDTPETEPPLPSRPTNPAE